MKAYTPILLIVLSIGLFFFYVQPQYYTINDNGDQLAALQAAKQQAQDAIVKRDSLINKYNSLNPTDIARLQAALPDTLDTIKLIVDMGSVASRYSTQLKNIRVSTANDGSGAGTYGTINLGFTITLPYDTFKTFLKDLERNLRISDITSVSFSPTDSGSNYDFNVSLKTYWLK